MSGRWNVLELSWRLPLLPTKSLSRSLCSNIREVRKTRTFETENLLILPSLTVNTFVSAADVFAQSQMQCAENFLNPSSTNTWAFDLIGLYHQTWGVCLSVSCLFAFSGCSWGSQGKNIEVVCHSHLQWTTFSQTSPPWPDCLGWPHMAWLSFIELDKAVAHVIRISVLWF